MKLSSERDKQSHSWIAAQSADLARAEGIGATVRTPIDIYSERTPKRDESDIASLILLAATLGIPAIPGAWIIEASSAIDPDNPEDYSVHLDDSEQD